MVTEPVRGAGDEPAGNTGAPSTSSGDGREARDEPHAADAHAHAEAAVDPAWRARHERYHDAGRIGRGGMAEVRRVRDHTLGRLVAMKMLPWDSVDSARARQRFFDEMRTTAALQHPGIVPVHDSGELPDGRLWFTMKEVRGVTLRAAIRELYEGDGEKWSLRRLVEVLARACEAVAYAHSRGVVHRDLKPENLMIGEFGEVLVMDWGLVKNLRIRRDEPREHASEQDGVEGGDSIDSAEELDGALRTMPGDVMGTPAYMSPEQAQGDIGHLGPPSDVYALGAVLYEILSGRPPYLGSVRAVWRLVRAGVAPQPVEAMTDLRFAAPPELAALCRRAMARDPSDRFADAGQLGAAVRAWLDGAYRRDQALALVEEARRMWPRLEELQGRARQLGEQARAALGALKPYAPASAKAEGWALEDRAAKLRREAAVEEVGWFQRLRAALNEVPDLPEAHELLADHYRDRLAAAEEARQVDQAAQYEALLRDHDRGKHAAFLGGRATLSLVTEPEGAEVSLYRHVEIDRVLVPEYAGELGKAPLHEVPVTKGSYLLRVRAPGYEGLAYPVFVGRGEHWSGVAPGESAPRPIRLMARGELASDEVIVPAGWFIAGGDPEAGESLPRLRLWAEAFAVQRAPVTNRQYLDFLNDLVRTGRGSDAVIACPRAGLGTARVSAGTVLFERDREGLFHLAPSAAPEDEELEWPIVFVDWHGASRYAEWRREKTGKPYRLLNELEWEKAARGVDGRLLPWGDHVDPSFACMLGSREGDPARVPVTRYPTDCSPYGVRGMAGNVRDWCINDWKPDGAAAPDGRIRIDPADPASTEQRSARGGAWTSVPAFCRLAARFAAPPGSRFGGAGFRLARSI